MYKVFLKDFLEKRDVLKHIFYAILIYGLLTTFISENPAYESISFDYKTLIFIFFALAINIYYFVKTYVSKVNTGAYYQLPVAKKEINLGFIEAITIDTLARKIILVLAAFLSLGVDAKYYIILLIATPLLCVLASVGVSQHIDSNKKMLILIATILCLGVFTGLIYYKDIYLVAIVILALYLFMVYKIFLPNTYFVSTDTSKISKTRIGNYFLKFILSENVYLINSAGLIITVIIIALLFPKNLALPLALMVATVNTPLMTILSTESDINTYRNLLPKSHKTLVKDYLLVIFAYYLLIHGLILFLFRSVLDKKSILLIIGLIIFDTLGAFYLENKHPIKDKKTTTEVWKHPRKYILGIIAFLLAFVVLNML